MEPPRLEGRKVTVVGLAKSGVAAARVKISTDEAKGVILERLHRLLVQTYEGYLRADQRACVAALENLHGKYAVTAKQIEAKWDEAAAKLKGFLVELGYE